MPSTMDQMVEAYEVGFNDGADNALESFCNTLVAAAGVPMIQEMSAEAAIRQIAKSMRSAGNIPFSVEEHGLDPTVRVRLSEIMEGK